MSGPLCCTTTREGHRQRSSSGCQCAAGAGGSIGYARTTVTERRGRDSLRRHHAFLSESCICSWAAMCGGRDAAWDPLLATHCERCPLLILPAGPSAKARGDSSDRRGHVPSRNEASLWASITKRMFRFREIKPSFSNRLNTRLVCSGVTASNSAISHCLRGIGKLRSVSECISRITKASKRSLASLY